MNSNCKKQLTLVIIILTVTYVRASADISDIQLISHMKKEAQDKIDKDIQLIESSIERLIRPQFGGIPTVIQKLDGITSEYYFPGEELKSQVVIEKNTNEQGKENVIIPMGENNFGHRAENSYVVLRQNKDEKNNDTYFFNIVYLRKLGKQTIVEWATVEKDQFRKSNLEIELCRYKKCEIPEWILGTCQIVEHACVLQNTIVGNSIKNYPNKASHMKVRREIKKLYAQSVVHPLEGIKSIEGNEALRVPSSLDLLMRPKKNKYTDDDSTFKNSILKAREIDNDHLENQALKCMQCQTVFDFFWDLEEQSLEFSQQVAKRIQKEDYSGLGQPSLMSIERILELHHNVPFVGFGNCNYSLEDQNRPKSTEIDDIIEFYLGTILKDCDNVVQSDIRGWLTSKLKFMRIETDLTLGLVATSQLLKSEMLSPKEFEMVMSVLLLTEYTNIYHEERALATTNNMGVPKSILNPIGLKISKICEFLTRLFFRLISSVRKVLDNHLVKALRAILRYMKDKFLSLLVEKRKLAMSLDTSSQDFIAATELTSNDLNQMMAIKEFTLYGTGPVFKSGTTPEVAFESFYKLNKKRIEFLVNAYDISTG